MSFANTQITYGGLTFGDIDANGVRWHVTDLQGWGSPASTLNPVANIRQPGSWAGDSFLAQRNLTLSLAVASPDAPTLNAALDSLSAACALSTQEMRVTQSGVTRIAYVRRANTPITEGRVSSVFATPVVQLVTVDGRKFADAMIATTQVAAASGTMTVPFTVPFTINSTVTSGTVSMVNAGNTTGPVTLTIQGPVSGPSISHVASGLTLAFASSLTLSAQEFLVVDMEAHTALGQGQASRSEYITSRQWFGFDPGQNVFEFTAATAGSGHSLTIQTMPAWL